MKRLYVVLAILISVSAFTPDATGQKLLNKMKKKLGQEADKSLNKTLGIEEKVPEGPDAANETESAEIDANVNENTGRKKIKPPDVKDNMNDAMSTFDKRSYADTRHHIEQALLGVEVEIGYEILNSFPENANSLNFNKDYDQVYSSGYGFAGLDIKRSYFNEPQEAEISVLSSSLLAMPMMMNSGGYSESQKPIRVNGHEGKLEAREDGSFFIGVVIGQETIFTLDLVNFKDEDEAIAFAESFDLDVIKSKLGEQ